MKRKNCMRVFTKEKIDEYADKLLIGLSEEENQMVLEEMSDIDASIDEALNTISNLSEVEPMSWCLDRIIDDLREDVVEDSIPIDELLSNSSKTSGDSIKVPKVVSE